MSTDPVDTDDTTLPFRAGILFLYYFIFALWQKKNLLGVSGERTWLVLRVFWGAQSMITGYWAMEYIPLGDASAIAFTAPVPAAILGFLFFKEPLHVINLVTCCMSVVGVLLISEVIKPPSIHNEGQDVPIHYRIIGSSLSAWCSVAQALVYLTLRKIRKTDPTITIMWHGFFSSLASIIFVSILRDWSAPRDWQTYLALFACGLTGVAGQYFMTLGLRYEIAAGVALTRTVGKSCHFHDSPPIATDH